MHTFGAPFGAQRSKFISRFCAHKTCAIVFLRVAVHHYLAFRSFLILLCCDTVKRLFLLFFVLAWHTIREICFLIPWQWLWGTFQKVLNIYHIAQLEFIFSGSIVSSQVICFSWRSQSCFKYWSTGLGYSPVWCSTDGHGQHWFCSQKRAKFEPPMRAPTICPTKSKFTWHGKKRQGIHWWDRHGRRRRCPRTLCCGHFQLKPCCKQSVWIRHCTTALPWTGAACLLWCVCRHAGPTLSILNGCTIHGWTTNCLSNTTEFHGTLTSYVMKKNAFFVQLSRKQTCAASNDRVLLSELTPIQNLGLQKKNAHDRKKTRSRIKKCFCVKS